MTGAEVFTIPAVDFSLGVTGGVVLSEIQYQVERDLVLRNTINDRDNILSVLLGMVAEVGLSVFAGVLFVAAALEHNVSIAGFCVGYLADKVQWLDGNRTLLVSVAKSH